MQNIVIDRPVRLRESVVSRQGPDGRTYLHDTITGRVFALKGPAQRIFNLLDGKRSLSDLESLVGVQPGSSKGRSLHRFLGGLFASSMLDTGSSTNSKSSPEISFENASREIPPGWKLVCSMRPNSNRVDRIERSSRLVLGAFLGLLVLSLIGFLYVGIGLTQTLSGNEMAVSSPKIIVATIVILLIQLMFHEAGHGLVLQSFGLPVRTTGLRFWFFVLPTPYVNQPAEIFLPSRIQRCLVALAGIAVDGLTGALVWFTLNRAGLTELALNWAFLHLLFLQINVNPLLPTDGARFIDGISRNVNLRKRSSRWALDRLLGRQSQEGNFSLLVKFYGFASLIFVCILGSAVLFRVYVVGEGIFYG